MLKTIYARTFLLLIAAIAVTQVVSLLLPAAQPDFGLRTMSMADIASQLRERGPPGPRGGPDAPPPRVAGSSPDTGPPPGPAPDMEAGAHRFGAPPGVFNSLKVGVVSMQPQTPEGSELESDGKLRTLLAEQLNQPIEAVVFLATPAELKRSVEELEPNFSKSFIAGARQSDGSWRVIRRQAESFPNAEQRHWLEALVLELAVLLPLAFIFARALAAPLRRFADAAQRVGQDSHGAPLLREGPVEVLAAVDSFNAMQARLARLLDERTRMVAAIAHDLRTPLTRLTFRLDDLPDPLGAKVRDDLKEMKSMIAAALDFIKDRSHGGPRERLDFRLLVERVANDFSDLGHRVSLEAGPPITLQGVPLALRRMTSNLIENALKYGERAEVRLSSSATLCTLEVDDDGPGIPESLHEQVFEPFFRVEASRNRETGGIGLGLSAVRAIVLEHGGDITLGNRKSGGLHVVVTLPVG